MPLHSLGAHVQVHQGEQAQHRKHTQSRLIARAHTLFPIGCERSACTRAGDGGSRFRRVREARIRLHRACCSTDGATGCHDVLDFGVMKFLIAVTCCRLRPPPSLVPASEIERARKGSRTPSPLENTVVAFSHVDVLPVMVVSAKRSNRRKGCGGPFGLFRSSGVQALRERTRDAAQTTAL